MLVWSEIPEIHPPLSLSPKPRGAVILSERAGRARAKDLLSRRLRRGASGTGRKQVLRACGAQDDTLALSGRGERKDQPPLSLSPKPRGAVILSERAARARAKDLLSRRLRKGARAKDLPSGRASGTGRKQVLRACGAQDDRPARFAKGERETTLPVPDPSDVAEPVTFAAVARSRTGDVPPTLGPNERFEHEARDQQDEAAGEGGNPMD